MAEAKSVLSIDVQDQPFRDFQAAFEKYRAQVGELPGAWKEQGDAAAASGGTFERMAAGIEKMAGTLDQVIERLTEGNKVSGLMLEQMASATAGVAAAEGVVVEKQRQHTTEVQNTTTASRGLERSTTGIAHNIKAATVDLLKWGSIMGVVGGLVGVGGGLFGVEHLAEDVSRERRAASGSGVSIGEDRAFSLDYGRYVDPGLPGRVADTQQDYSKRWAFGAIGINQSDVSRLDPAQLAQEVVEKGREAYLHSDRSEQQASALGLLNFFSMSDLRRLGSTPDAEINSAGAAYSRDRNTFDLSEDQAKKWQDLQVQLSRAGESIEKTFIVGLTPLAPALGHLSSSVEGLIQALLSQPDLKRWINEVATGIEEFAHYLGTPQFKQDVQDFVHDISLFIGEVMNFAHGVHEALVRLGLVPGDAKADPSTPEHPEAPEKNADGTPKYGISGWGWSLGRGTHWETLTPPPSDVGALDPKTGKQVTSSFLGIDTERPVKGISPEEMKAWMAGAKPIEPMMAGVTEMQQADAQGVPEDFARALFHNEGGLNPDGSAKLSTAGAIGAGQLMPGTAKMLGVNPFDQEQNIKGSVAYMSLLLKEFGNDRDEAAAAYNAGPGAVQSAIDKYGSDWLSHLHKETRDYVSSMRAQTTQKSAQMKPWRMPPAQVTVHTSPGAGVFVTGGALA